MEGVFIQVPTYMSKTKGKNKGKEKEFATCLTKTWPVKYLPSQSLTISLRCQKCERDIRFAQQDLIWQKGLPEEKTVLILGGGVNESYRQKRVENARVMNPAEGGASSWEHVEIIFMCSSWHPTRKEPV